MQDTLDYVAMFRSTPGRSLVLAATEPGIVLDASNSFIAEEGIGRDEILGRSVFSIFREPQWGFGPEQIDRVRASLVHVRLSRTPDAIELHAQGRPGAMDSTYWLITHHPVLDVSGRVSHIVQTFDDMSDAAYSGQQREGMHDEAMRASERYYNQRLRSVLVAFQAGERRRREAEVRAMEAGERLALAVDAAELGSFYCPMPLEKIYWNDKCKEHFFLPPDAEVDFDLFYARLHPEDREMTRMSIEACIAGEAPYDVNYRVVAPDGRERWLRAKGNVYYDANGLPLRFDGITIDITRTKAAEDELRKANRQKDEFLAMLAHELRNPLAPIAAATDLLTLGNISPSRLSQICEILRRQVTHMTGLLDDLLDVARIARGQIRLQKESLDPKSILSVAIEQVTPLIEEREHELVVTVAPTVGVVLGDEKRLIQAITNLLVNAAKYTPMRGRIEIEMRSEDQWVSVSVKDNGIGIDSNALPRIFDLFMQAEQGVDRSAGGLGLGLTVVNRLVELHGGAVTAASDGKGRGSVFTLRLPQHAKDHTHEAGSSVNLAAGFSSAPRRILIVDDNVDVTQLLSELLRYAGHDVRAILRPNEALATIESFRPEVCILDLGLPEMDGVELGRQIRGRLPDTRPLLVALSGYSADEDKRWTRAAGFDLHLSKPINIAELLLQVDQLFKQPPSMPLPEIGAP